MDTFDTLDELWLGAAERIFDDGHQVPSRDGHTTEILGYVGRLTDPTACLMLNPIRKASPSYAAAELLWYLSGSANVERVAAYAPQYTRFTEDGVHAFGAYGDRWLNNPGFVAARGQANMDPRIYIDDEWAMFHLRGTAWDSLSQLQMVAWMLHRNPDSRQAIVTMWDAGDLSHATVGGKKDLPCTLSLNFIVRDGKLFLTATMRSNDLWLGLPYDAWSFCSLQIILADILGLELGWYQHQAMSLHVYDRNEERAREAAVPPSFSVSGLAYEPLTIGFNEAVATALMLEEFLRTNGLSHNQGIEALGEKTWLGQVLILAGHKWHPKRGNLQYVHTKAVRDYLNIHWTDSLPLPKFAEGDGGATSVPRAQQEKPCS